MYFPGEQLLSRQYYAIIKIYTLKAGLSSKARNISILLLLFFEFMLILEISLTIKYKNIF